MNTICAPYKGAKIQDISQYYSETHQALDFCPLNPYGTSLVCPFEYGKINNMVDSDICSENEDEMFRGFGITIQECDKNGNLKSMYCGYWHTFSEFPFEKWDIVKRGDVVAYMGNSGDVFAGKPPIYVPLECRESPNHPGTHLHCFFFILNEFKSRALLLSINLNRRSISNTDHCKAAIMRLGSVSIGPSR